MQLRPAIRIQNDKMSRPTLEIHRSGRAGWLRAAVLGADDGIVSTASLMIGVAAAGAPHAAVVIAGVAGLAAGAMAMAAGEYVSVSSQRDSEDADIKLETKEIAQDPGRELSELAAIYVKRGLEPALARTVAERLSASNVLETHLRDELGLGPTARARPIQAGAVSAVSFAGAAAIPLIVAVFAPTSARLAMIAVAALASLGLLGIIGGRIGGAPAGKAAIRVIIGGTLAMVVTALIGRLAGGIGL